MSHRVRILIPTLSLGLGMLLTACSSDPLVQPGDAVVLPSGVAYKVLQAGKSDQHPVLSDSIIVNYTLWQPAHTDTPPGAAADAKPVSIPAKQLESTWDAAGKPTPATFPLGKLIRGWQQMLPLMTPGERVRVWIPSDLAYGDHPTRADHPPAGPLVFEIELVSIAPASP
ncbi:MAG TPA: FKBP-type peptidyl-prolyl cis-trans isomerase [Gammaproteobacteria bacterium]|nr:FKBP-type peptidyl-prolyl cis-trans isomerase [Gammaproteobacteria bacterium]